MWKSLRPDAPARWAWQVASGLGEFHIVGMQVASALTLTVNGGAVEAPDGTTVAGLLNRLGLDRRKVAVERNEEIVVRSTYDMAVLQAGDRIEIVHFIGGG